MSSLSDTLSNKPEELPAEFADLIAAVEGLSLDARHKLDPLLVRVIESSRRRRRILNLVQDALSQLRLDMKYLIFDLEATRRERDDLKRRFERHQAESGFDGPDAGLGREPNGPEQPGAGQDETDAPGPGEFGYGEEDGPDPRD